MKSRFRYLILLCAAAGVVAHAETITFDGQPAGQMTSGSSFTEGDFTITALPGDPGDTALLVNVGSPNNNVFVDGNPYDVYGTVIQITLTNGGTFDLNSLDVADLNNGGGLSVGCGSGYRIELTSSNPGDCADFGPASSTFTTVSPASGFTEMSYLDVNIVSDLYYCDGGCAGNNFAVDNIVLTPDAPEPSSVVLGLTGLFAIAFRMRRRRP